MPEVSIVIPVYNVIKYFEKCMASVLSQKMQDFEVILVDDGSTDGSGALCDRYAAEDERVFALHQSNAGLSAARNAGLANARGTYVCFIDSDDYVSEAFLGKSLAAAKRYQADLVIFVYDFVDETGSRLFQYHAGLEPDRLLTLKTTPELINVSPSSCNKLYRKALLERAEACFPEGRLYEDLATTPKLFFSASAVYLPETLYYYVNHKGSIMRMAFPDPERRYQDRVFAVDSVRAYYAEKGLAGALRENLEFLAIYHIYFMLSIETLAEDPRSAYLKKFREYIRREYPDYKKNPWIPVLFTKRERIKFRLLNGRHYRLIVFLGKIKGVLR